MLHKSSTLKKGLSKARSLDSFTIAWSGVYLRSRNWSLKECWRVRLLPLRSGRHSPLELLGTSPKTHRSAHNNEPTRKSQQTEHTHDPNSHVSRVDQGPTEVFRRPSKDPSPTVISRSRRMSEQDVKDFYKDCLSITRKTGKITVW